MIGASKAIPCVQYASVLDVPTNALDVFWSMQAWISGVIFALVATLSVVGIVPGVHPMTNHCRFDYPNKQ